MSNASTTAPSVPAGNVGTGGSAGSTGTGGIGLPPAPTHVPVPPGPPDMLVLTATLLGTKSTDSVARLFSEKYADTEWELALTKSLDWWTPYDAGASAAGVWTAISIAMPATHALVLHEGKIRLVYGLRCRATARVVGLMGDRVRHGSMVVEPQMYQSGGTQNDQVKLIAKLSFKPPALADVIAAISGGADLAAQVDTQPEITVPASLVVHPKLGCLFMDGLTPLAALLVVRQIRDASPASGPATKLLLDFCLASAVAGLDATGAATTSPVLLSDGNAWARVDPHTDVASTEWYLEYLSVTIPPAPTVGPPNPVNPTPPTS